MQNARTVSESRIFTWYVAFAIRVKANGMEVADYLSASDSHFS